MKRIYEALKIQRNFLIGQCKTSKELDCLQFYLWHCYKIRPVYFTEKDCRHGIERLAVQMHNPLQRTKFISNGTIRTGGVNIQSTSLRLHVDPKLPNEEPGTFFTSISCRSNEARYLLLLYEMCGVLD